MIMKILKKVAAFAAVALGACLLPWTGTGESVSASAAGYGYEIEQYAVEYTVRADRQIEVKERVTVQFYDDDLTMVYHALPLEGDRYYDMQASCAGNNDFSFYVADNPDVDGFLDINCVGGVRESVAQKKPWTYDISYKMEIGAEDIENGMLLDVVGFGSAVPLNDVSVVMRFPAPATVGIGDIFIGGYGATANEVDFNLSEDKKTLTLQKERLDLAYNDTFGERMAEGITVRFTLGEGVLESYTKTRLFTDGMWKIVLGGVIVVALAVLLLVLTKKKRDLITVVNIKAPDDMDPMQMGKLLDGTVDTEDITSMLYYFAYKGELSIDLTDEDDPVLIKKVDALPAGTPAYQKTLFNGLFKNATLTKTAGKTPFDEDTYTVSVKVSDLKEKFYESADKAKMQVRSPKMYEKKSVFGYIAGGLLCTLYAFALSFIMGLRVGGDYTYFLGIVFFVPAAIILLLGWVKENYRYKWKKSAFLGASIAQGAIAVLFTLIFCFLFGEHVMTEYEKLAISLFAFAALFATSTSLSRTERYVATLGDILGFKEFIVVTEEDKIKFMLQDNPELYYKILPYAQVLGVTDEWTDKFKNITLEPPAWCTGARMDFFDYWLLNRCMTRAMVVAMSRPRNNGGSFVGRSGGGGSFGGFGGGGHGGGGFGAR